MKILRLIAGICLFFMVVYPDFAVSEELGLYHKNVLNIANECRSEIVDLFNSYIGSGKLKVNQIFDTFYIPIPNTYPQKYHTQYDMVTDEELRKILDNCLEKDKNFIFVVAVDKNGYLPTHNTKYSQKLTGNPEIDILKNRTKRIFNDRTGLAAARNTEPYLLQSYNRDTGEKMYDLSVPIFINNKHWGALRIGYKEK
ncbi:chemotaxis protein [Deferribacteraceae bacterium V6Fe1]|nr:chemotaxis protein [Deferribacteraceae bacterium V6Fe1]